MKKNFLQIENHPDLVRDASTGAIINKNNDEYRNYLSNYERLKRERDEMESLRTDVSSLKSDIDVIKTLLLNLTEKQNDN
jgi:hypothetical protein